MNWQQLSEEQADDMVTAVLPFTGVNRVIDDRLDEDDEDIREIEAMDLDHERRMKVKSLFGNDYDRLREQNAKLEQKLTPPLDDDEDYKVLQRLISSGKIKLLDKDNCNFCPYASNVVPLTQGRYLITSDR